MTYLIIKTVTEDNKPSSVNYRNTEKEAVELVSEIGGDSFYVVNPNIDLKYITVNTTSKSITVNTNRITMDGYEVRIKAIKAEAMRRILARCKGWQQSNIQFRALFLLEKGEANWTAEEVEQSRLDRIEVLWIQDMQARSGELEISLPDDYTNDTHWVFV